ncbi:hypothetical protein MTR67_012344 [Solanum verrucosum]|uniref:Endonuclease/exonuclease/phosphatase domain-containing protein n=1 Tax=Solanum verrucosum TaxID=315347 RepID=A0AAF0Q8E8_SOLVR|nr:hypothetical protein MTR67_012344 [Solanum verrucosum]
MQVGPRFKRGEYSVYSRQKLGQRKVGPNLGPILLDPIAGEKARAQPLQILSKDIFNIEIGENQTKENKAQSQITPWNRDDGELEVVRHMVDMPGKNKEELGEKSTAIMVQSFAEENTNGGAKDVIPLGIQFPEEDYNSLNTLEWIQQNIIKLRLEFGDFKWHLTGVYAPNDRVEREETWWEVGAARGLFTGPWVLCGDFNTVRYPSEKFNCSRISRSMTDLSEFIEDMELMDLDLAGGEFTWRKGERHSTAARLDRFMISEDWDTKFRNIKQSILQRIVSDHSPLMLQCGEWGSTKSYFKFENWWLTTEGRFQ